MSYILDALRKADAQRERDPARGIHAQPLRESGTASPATGPGPWLWGAGALGIAALAAAGWYLSPDSGADAPKVANRAEPPTTRRPGASPQPVPVPAPVAGNAVAPPVAAPVPVVATAIEPPPPIARPVTPPMGESRASSVPMMRGNQRAGAPQPPAPTPAPLRAPPPTPSLPPAPPAPPAQPVAGLPAEAPKLIITGGVYSTNPVQRMLIVNGQVLNEGSEVASGVVLEEIKPKGAVLRFRGSRYTVSY